MTHDELLAKLSIPIILKAGVQETDIVNLNLLVKERQALRAVVELHKPYGAFIDLLGVVRIECHYCHCDYPCNTIQAIEKELG